LGGEDLHLRIRVKSLLILAYAFLVLKKNVDIESPFQLWKPLVKHYNKKNSRPKLEE